MGGSSPEENTTSSDSDDGITTSSKNETMDSTTIDKSFDVLADATRRAIITYFVKTENTTATASELTQYSQRKIVREENVLARDRLMIQLHHIHLPMLEDIGILEYDTRSKTVRYHGDDVLEQFLLAIQRCD